MVNIKDYVKVEEDYIISLRRHFHRHPEPSLEEYNTALKIEQELEALGINHKRVGKTGVLGIIKGKQLGDKKLVLRADIDALRVQDLKEATYKSITDGVMHACGHDGHTASLLGAAKILKAKETEMGGELYLFFQQAEEIGQGAKVFIEEGYLDTADRIFGIHVTSDLDVGKVSVTKGAVNASCDYFKIIVRGQSAHVSTPQKSVDALYIASQIVIGLQAIVSRQTNPLDTVVVGIGVMRAGTAYNVIANEAILEGTTRSFSVETRNKTNHAVIEIAKQIGSAYGALVEVVFEDYASPLINNNEVCDEIAAIAEKIVTKEGVITTREKSLGADDFAEYLLKVPGMYAYVGTRNENNSNTGKPHHNGSFDMDEQGLLIATNLYVDYALDQLK